MRAVGVAVAVATWMVAPAWALAANPIQAENAHTATSGWSSVAETASIEGYADRTSVAPGESVGFHIASSDAGGRYRLVLFRLGWYGGGGARLVTCLPSCDGDKDALHPPPRPIEPGDGEVQAGWPATDVLTVGADWVSGYYEARVVLTAGPNSGRAHRIWFFVREARLDPSAVLVQVPVNTWQAYNSWGGHSLYDFNSRNGRRASRVSFDRPYAIGMPGSQASPVGWEYQLVRFLEREGVDVSYQTDLDTDRDPGSLLSHRLVMTAGHSEYWTKAMRDAFEAARDQGTNLAFLGANNAYWQVRYENDRRKLVGYKSDADPVADPTLKTILFRDLDRPECQLVGVQHEGWLRQEQGDYLVEPSVLDDPWFAGTGFTAWSAVRGVVSREYDSLPLWQPAGCHQPGLRVLFHDAGAPRAESTRYVAPSGARVFASGSLQFSWGLDAFGTGEHGHTGADPRLQQFMRNALDDLGRPASPAPVAAAAEPGLAVVSPTRLPDPRLEEIVVVRHDGPDEFDPTGDRTVLVCRTLTLPCRDRVPGHRVYRYAATAVDRWASSKPAFSDPVAVPNSTPHLRVSGPKAVRIGTRALYVANTSDVDGDAVALRWLVNKRAMPARGSRLVITFGAPRRHHLTVIARDGHGGVSRATRIVRVTSR
jgi:hypothetical protein